MASVGGRRFGRTKQRARSKTGHPKRLASRSPAAPYLVFISHSSRDSFVAGVLAEKVQGSGAEVWLDAKDLAGGSPILETVMETVDKCQEAVVLVLAKE